MNKMNYQYNFEKLEIWELAIEMSVSIYSITKDFPKEEKFGLVSQLRRASNSISANIAEGNARLGEKDKARFIQIAYGSTIEVLNHLILAQKLGFIDEKTLNELRIKIQELTNKLNSFHNSIQKKQNKQ